MKTVYNAANDFPELGEMDLDGDGVTDVRTLYRDGVAHTVEYLDPNTQKVARLEHVRLGAAVTADWTPPRSTLALVRWYRACPWQVSDDGAFAWW